MDLGFFGHPDQILANPIAAIRILLLVQIVRSAAGCHLGGKFRRTFDKIIFTVTRLPARVRENSQNSVGLRLVIQVQAITQLDFEAGLAALSFH